jgi:hypothetical protein
MSATLEQLTEEVRGLRCLMESVAAVLQPAAQSRPLTAEELMVRWAVPGETLELRLDNLGTRCRAWGLKPMRGTRGVSATYMVADVVAAEGFANGTTKRRRRL